MKDLTKIAQNQIKRSYIPEKQATIKEESGLGIAISTHYKWDGVKIMRCFASALEDSNFHDHCSKVRNWIKEITGGDEE